MELGVITAGIPEIDGCPVLTRVKAFIVDQGTAATLEHTFRDRSGRPVDLSDYLAASDSESLSESTSSTPGGAVLRVKEWDSVGGHSKHRNPLWTLTAEPYDQSGGVLRAALDPDIVERAGLYQLSWAVLNSSGRPIAVNDGLLSVERSLYPNDPSILYSDLGPPTVNEIRMAMRDSGRGENLLLDDFEFGDDQILQAIVTPVQYWNEALPPIRTYTTRNFPFRYNWKRAIVAYLMEAAAHGYRRNRLATAAGGVSVDDQNKEREYLMEADRRLTEFRDWVLNKKTSINAGMVGGSFGSSYGGRGYW